MSKLTQEDVMMITSRINDVINDVTDNIISMHKLDWHIVETALRNYFKGANVFIESDNVREFVNSENTRTTLIGEIIYDLFTSKIRARDIDWFKSALNASFVNPIHH